MAGPFSFQATLWLLRGDAALESPLQVNKKTFFWQPPLQNVPEKAYPIDLETQLLSVSSVCTVETSPRLGIQRNVFISKELQSNMEL